MLTVPIQDGTIKLVDVTNSSTTVKGAPLIYHEGIWGAFCLSKMTNIEANVICRQLGYATSSSHECCYTDFATHDKVWVNEIKCTGNEIAISQCKFTYGLDASDCFSRAEIVCSSKSV